MLRRIHSPLADSKAETLLAFNSVETDLQAKYPTMLYADILAHAHAELASRLANKPSQTTSAKSEIYYKRIDTIIL